LSAGAKKFALWERLDEAGHLGKKPLAGHIALEDRIQFARPAEPGIARRRDAGSPQRSFTSKPDHGGRGYVDLHQAGGPGNPISFSTGLVSEEAEGKKL